MRVGEVLGVLSKKCNVGIFIRQNYCKAIHKVMTTMITWVLFYKDVIFCRPFLLHIWDYSFIKLLYFEKVITFFKYYLATQSRVLLEKSIIVQMVKELSVFYGT